MSAKTNEEKQYDKIHQSLLINGMTPAVADFLAQMWLDVQENRRFKDSILRALAANEKTA